MYKNTFKYYIKVILRSFLLYCGFIKFRNFINKTTHRSLITVLTYHRIDIDGDDVNAIDPITFEKQMILLKNKYKIISISELLKKIELRSNNERCVVITFDDGYLDNFTNAAPILKKHEIPACFFISTGNISNNISFEHDQKRLGKDIPVMTWNQVKELKDMGFDIGSHTVNHTRLSSCDISSLQMEILDSKIKIQTEIGCSVRYFSYPFGQPEDITGESIEVLKNNGYVCNFSSFGGLVRPADDVYNLKRISIPNEPSLLFFEAWVEGWKIRC